MSCNYADGLSPYHDKGQLGLEERFDSKSVVSAKVSLLTKWINEAKHVVVHTGAGISTSAGIPDFRGPRGVWTLQAKGEKPDLSKEFNEAIPTPTHMAITKLVEKGKIKYVVSQNIDGLHLRSNLQRKFLSELHGNMFTEQCSSCNRQFVRSMPVPSVGQKSLNKPCLTLKANGRPCRGRLHDTILDWEHNLPENDLGMADYHSCLADLSICLGTTMQIVPSGNLPLYTKKHGGKLIIVNLQPTKHDRKADLLIHAYVDEVMAMLMKNLNLKIPKYSAKNDPTRTLSLSSEKFLEWTISDYALRKMKKIYEEKCGTKEARKRLEMIDDDIPLSITKNLKRKAKEEDDSDLEVLDVIVKPKKSRESSKRGPKKKPPPDYNPTITIKKVTPAPAPKKGVKYEGEKITIKKNVTPTKTKYEIVTKPKKVAKCEIVYNTDSDLCNDLDMICESDDDEMTNNFTYNFKRYLHDDVKKEDVKDVESIKEEEKNVEVKAEVKSEIKVEGEDTANKKDEESNQVKNEEEEKANEGESTKSSEVAGESVPEKDKTDEVVPMDVSESVEETAKAGEKEDIKEESEVVKPEETSCENPDENDKQNDENDLQIVTETADEKPIEDEREKPEDKKEEEETNVTEDNEPIVCESSATAEENPLQDTPQADSEEKTETKTSEETSANEEGQEEVSKTTESEDPNDVAGEIDSSDKSKPNETDKTDNIYSNIESELSNLSNHNLESQIDQMVDQTPSSQFENALGMSNMNPSMSENYEFYSNDYNASNNPTDLDYVDNTYYNNF